MLIAVTAPSTTQAATYSVAACGPAAGGANHSWAYRSTTTVLESGAACPADGSEYSGLWVRDVIPSGTDFNDGQSGDWVLTAPPGLAISGITYSRWLYKQDDDDLQPSLRTADGAVLDGCTLGSPTFTCTVGAAGSGSSASFTALATPSLSFGVRCATGDPLVVCATGGTIHHVRAALYNASVTISDSGVPTLGGASGSLLAGGWLRGAQTAGVVASDASGISRERVLLADGAAQEIGALDLSCDYTYVKPCGDQGSAPAVTVATSSMSDGVHQVRVTAADAAGNEALSTPVSVQIDNTAPAAPTGLAIAEGATTTASALHASWRDPAGQVAPITEAHWSVCAQDGTNCQTGNAASSPATIPAPEGTERVKVWLQDAAGNTDPSTAAAADVTVDRTAPSAPTAMTSTVADGPSTARQVTTTWANPAGQVSPITGAHWQICVTGTSACTTGDVASSPLVSTLDPGSYTIRVWLQDAAGNTDGAMASSTTVTVPPASTGGGGGTTTPPTPSAPTVVRTPRKSPALTLSRILRGDTLTMKVVLDRQARGDLKLRVVGRRRGRIILTRRRTVQPSGGAFRWSIRIPRSVTRLSISAAYAGDAQFLPASRGRTLTRG